MRLTTKHLCTPCQLGVAPQPLSSMAAARRMGGSVKVELQKLLDKTGAIASIGNLPAYMKLVGSATKVGGLPSAPHNYFNGVNIAG